MNLETISKSGLVLLLTGVFLVHADESPNVQSTRKEDVKVHVVKPVMHAPAPQPFFVGHPAMMPPPEMMGAAVGIGAHVDGKVIKNKPFSAAASTEHVRVLGDGNRIVNTQRSRQFRDSAGRTRHEQLGVQGAEEGLPISIRISDPVTQESWLLIPHGRIAIRLPRLEMVVVEGGPVQEDVFTAAVPAPEATGHAPHVMIAATQVLDGGAPVPEPSGFVPAPGAAALPGVWIADEQTENVDLGQKVVEGLDTRGERTTHTLPANAIGNEQPVTRVTETWHADAIESVVLMTVNDPLQGDMTYALTDIQQADVSADLFVVPDDYKKVEEPAAIAPHPH